MPVDEAFDARLHDCDPEEHRDKNKGECDGDGRLMAHRSFTLRAFREEGHVAILSSTSYPMVKSALKRQHVERRIVLELPGFLVLAAIVSSTDLVATVPRTIGETLAATGSVRVFPCPVKIPNFSVKQYWHFRYHHDPGNQWLRSICSSLFANALKAPKR